MIYKKSGGFSIKVLIERIRVQLRKKDINIILKKQKILYLMESLNLIPHNLSVSGIISNYQIS